MARPATHRDGHRSLIRRVDTTGGHGAPQLDAVIVPAAREAAGLVNAADVARANGSTLVVLCSHDSRAAEALTVARARRLPERRIVAVDLPTDQPDGVPALSADRIDTGLTRARDTGLKRNLGIRLAVLLGWRQVLFLDDDVAGPSVRSLAAAQRALAVHGGPGAVGWAFEDYPDNSVVCHAHRLAGGAQSTFVGAGGLLLRVDERLPHFPGVYNEDWLFFTELMQRRERGLGFGGALRQAAFDPFAAPEHARRQEFGDVLGEGLFALLHTRTPVSAATSSGYWQGYLNVRRRFLLHIDARLSATGNGSLAAQRDAARACVATALQTLETHRTQWQLDLPAYITAWRQDAALWRRVLARTTATSATADGALERLGLARATGAPQRPAGGLLQRTLVTAYSGRRKLTRS
jgi:hypothetical protein